MRTPIIIRWFVVVAIITSLSGCRSSERDRTKETEDKMIENSIKLLQTSDKSEELAAVAVALARGSLPEGHEALQKQMQSAEFYYRLDSKKAYGNFGERLELYRVVTALSENKAESAHKALIALSQSSIYKNANRRITMLITACAAVRPAPPEIVRFWDSYSQAETGFSSRTVSALVINGSPPALVLLEKKFADPKHEDEDKVDWMHRPILEHRNEAPLLECCLRILKGPMSDELKAALVETIFDYQPKDWYPGKRPSIPAPPPPSEVGKDAHVEMRKIGEYAVKNVELSEELKETVESYLEATSPDKS